MRQNTLRRHERLTRKREFEGLLALGQVVRSPAFNVYFDTGGQDWRQAGFIVSRKVASTAAVRARIKRRLKEVFRRNKSRLAIGTRVAFRAKPSVKDYSYAQLEDIFRQLAERIVERTR